MVPQKKEMKKMFKAIRLRFDSTRQMVSQVEMTEQGGDTTLITLKDVKLNGKVDEKMFVAQ
jgi:outer membrane lipoprotein-sorting protein